MTNSKAHIDPLFWRGRKVFLTGHTGFKGTWLTCWLHSLGAQLFGYSLPPEGPTYQLFRDSRLEKSIASHYGDILERDRLQESIESFQPELILHLAAQALVRESYSDPIHTYAVNVMGTAHVLEAARRTDSVQAVLVVTTDKCYENQEWLWPYRENDRLGGHDPYSNSKACAELVVDSYRRSFLSSKGVLVATARAGNVIGGGDMACDRLVPDAVRAFAKGAPLEIRCPGATRPWQHVLDPLHGYLLLAQSLLQGDPESAEAFNFGPPDEHTVGEVVNTLTSLWGDGASVETPDGEHPHEASRLHLDSRKAHHKLGWKPHFDFHRALEATITFYKSWLAHPSQAFPLMVGQLPEKS